MEEYLSSLQDLHSKQEELESELQQTKRHLFEKIQESYHIMQEQMVAILQDHTHRVLTTVAETIDDTEGKVKDTLDITKHMIQDVKVKADTVRRLRLHNEEADKGDDSRMEKSNADELVPAVMTWNEEELREEHELHESLETTNRFHELDDSLELYSEKSHQLKSSTVENQESVLRALSTEDELQKKHALQESLETTKRLQELDDSLQAFSKESLQLKSGITVESQESFPRAISIVSNPLNYSTNLQCNYSIRSPCDSNKCEICAVCCLDNGRIFLADANNKCLKIFDNSFGLLKCISSDLKLEQPTGLCHINENYFVLSDRGHLKYFSIDSNGNTHKNRNSVTVGIKSWSVVSHHECIYVLCENNKYPFYNIWHYGELGRHYGRHAMEGQFMCFNSNGTKLYVTDGVDQDTKSNTVRVFNRKTSGKKMFEKVPELFSQDLKTPCGVVTDKYDQVYVCGFESKNIIKFNKHGNQVDVLLDEENALTGQKILGYDKTNHRLIVAGNSDEIKIIDLK